MKKALTLTMAALLSLLLFTATAYGQEQASEEASPQLLEQELTAMEAVFGDLEALMTELITEIKGNMGDIGLLDDRLEDFRDVVEAVSIEIKTAEGRIVGLRDDVDELTGVQQDLKSRVGVLEEQLASLTAQQQECCDALEAAIALAREELQASIDERTAELQAAIAATDEELQAAIAKTRSELDSALEQLEMMLSTAIQDSHSELSASITSARSDLESAITEVVASLGKLEEEFAAWLEDYTAFHDDYAVFREASMYDISELQGQVDNLFLRVQSLEDEDIGSFKLKVLELERNFAALSIRVENNRTKLEGFDQAIADLAFGIEQNSAAIQSTMSLLEDHDSRLLAAEDGTMVAELEAQLGTVYFISILGLLAGVGALAWTLLGG
ncbi:hypothetical protein JW848_03920 [Candidatus Bipolaricaulota bacterium]|nr:hypothetical protein [Candidatus Bipolaricaulota bacterium]